MNPFLGRELQRDLVLASASPRRREILERLGFEFEVLATGIEENDIACADHRAFRDAGRRAEGRGGAGARPGATDHRRRYDRRRAGTRGSGSRPTRRTPPRCSRSLSGRTHEVITGIAVARPDGTRPRGRRADAGLFSRAFRGGYRAVRRDGRAVRQGRSVRDTGIRGAVHREDRRLLFQRRRIAGDPPLSAALGARKERR